MASRLWGEKQSQELAWWIRRAIVRRTVDGTSAEGRRFKLRKDGSSTNLMRTGYMVDTVYAEATEDSLTIRSRAPYAGYVDQERPWLGLTEDQQREADREFARLLDEAEAQLNTEWKARNR